MMNKTESRNYAVAYAVATKTKYNNSFNTRNDGDRKFICEACSGAGIDNRLTLCKWFNRRCPVCQGKGIVYG